MNRLFLAIPALLFDYKRLQDDFAPTIEGKWIPPQNLHLTLQFFGERFEKESIIEKLSRLNLQVEPSELKGLSLFEHNQILYAKTENRALSSLHAQIQEAFMLAYEQAFIPHVTLMRIKKIHDRSLFEQELNCYKQEAIGTLRSSIQLMQSRITSEGATYTCVQEF